MYVLGYIAVVEASNSCIQDDTENEREIENGKINHNSHPRLYSALSVDSEYIKRLIKRFRNSSRTIGQEFFLL
jgi:hypothetical protein